MKIRQASMEDYEKVEDLWKKVNLFGSWMQNRKAIERKVSREPDLFLIAEEGEKIAGVALVGFDGQFGNTGQIAADPTAFKKFISFRK